MNINDVKRFMIQWNKKFPVDFWWREKHKVAFLSPEHKECSFIHQLMELQEDLLHIKKKENIEEEIYTPNIGDIFKSKGIETTSSNGEILENDLEWFREQAKMIESKENDPGRQENTDNR